MKLKASSGIVRFSKAFATGFIYAGMLKLIRILIYLLSDRRIETSYHSMPLWSIVLMSFILAIFIYPQYIQNAKSIRTEDKILYTKRIIKALDKMKWKIELQEENKIVFKSSFWASLWPERIIVRFTDTELQICGPYEHIDRAVRLSKFPYKSFEINNFE